MKFNSKEQCEEQFIKHNSTFIKSILKNNVEEKFPLTDKCSVFYTCCMCKKECEKKWQSLKPKDGIFVPTCIECAVKFAIEKKQKTILEKKTELSFLINNTPDGQQYCPSCKKYKNVVFFKNENTKHTNTHCMQCYNMNETLLRDSFMKYGAELTCELNKKVLLLDIISFKCRCLNIHSKTVDSIINHGALCPLCIKKKSSESKAETHKKRKMSTSSASSALSIQSEQNTDISNVQLVNNLPAKKYNGRLDMDIVRYILENQGSYLLEDSSILINLLAKQDIKMNHTDAENYIKSLNPTQNCRMWIMCKNINCNKIVNRQLREFDTRTNPKKFIGPLCEQCAKLQGNIKKHKII